MRAVTKVLGKVSGVDDVICSVENKTVDVMCDESVNESDLLTRLETWASASGKEVQLKV